MRILIVNDGVNDAGGVQSYLDAVVPALLQKGHEVCFLHQDSSASLAHSSDGIERFSITDSGVERAFSNIKEWKPDICFSHNMSRLDVERELLNLLPVVKLMHGYFGTCIGGQKTHLFPSPQPCQQRFGKACLAQYLPRRCGQTSLVKLREQYLWAKEQNRLFNDYTSVIVASQHMKREFIANGMDEEKIEVNPLFPALRTNGSTRARPHHDEPLVMFMGRMTKLKGGDVLIRAVAEASRLLQRRLRLVMIGDGPQRGRWEKLARRLNISHIFTGWTSDENERARWLAEASLLAVPSIWPEPFGLTGLEAGWAGVPAIAFDVGGISEWLEDGVNGFLVKAHPPDDREFARALVAALSQPERLDEMGRAARQRAVEMSLEKHLNHLERTLASACSQTLAAQSN